MLPSNSPFIIQKLICTSCGEVMRLMIDKQANGKPVKFNFFCDSPQCLYGFTSQTYAIGENVPHDKKQDAKTLFNYAEVAPPIPLPTTAGTITTGPASPIAGVAPMQVPVGGVVPVKTPPPVPAAPSSGSGVQSPEPTSTNNEVTEPKASETQGAQ